MFLHGFLGKVVDNQDPDGLHRIRVGKLGEKETVTDWISVLSAYAGSDAGLSLLPDVDSQVLVVSLDEDSIKKVAIGGIWSNGSAPPETGENSSADRNQDGKNALRFFKSRSGHMFIFDDTEGAERVQLISFDKKSRLDLNTPDELVILETKNDLSIGAKGILTIQAEEIAVNSKKQINFEGEEFQTSAKKTLDINADQDIAIKGSGLTLN
jgi:uncharacterized protein involved in type VI secretion and phage assembly